MWNSISKLNLETCTVDRIASCFWHLWHLLPASFSLNVSFNKENWNRSQNCIAVPFGWKTAHMPTLLSFLLFVVAAPFVHTDARCPTLPHLKQVIADLLFSFGTCVLVPCVRVFRNYGILSAFAFWTSSFQGLVQIQRIPSFWRTCELWVVVVAPLVSKCEH